jgi:hypothetical protein
MDTTCTRCKRYGTFNDRLQCTQCRRVVESKSCWFCDGAGIRESNADASTPILSVNPRPAPNVVDPNAVPPRLASAVGGAVFGVAAGAAAAYFLSESVLICTLAGAGAGTLIGALLGGGGSSARRP